MLINANRVSKTENASKWCTSTMNYYIYTCTYT